MITVATPTYNRARTLHRVFESLVKQEYKDFEWIVVDDGSTDNTEEVIEGFNASEHSFPIIYVRQEKSGKHFAVNKAVELASGEMFVTVDSDDAFTPNAFKFMHDTWESLPEEMRKELKGIAVRRCPPDNFDKILGEPLPIGKDGYIKSDDEEMHFKYKFKSGFGGMTRTEVMREFPFPEERGINYFPEGIIWGRMGRKYKTLYFDVPLEVRYDNEGDQMTSSVRYKERIFLRKYIFEELVPLGYFKYAPKYFVKQAVALWRDGLLCGLSSKEILKIPKTVLGKLLAIIGYPAGKVLYMKEKSNKKD